MSRGPRIRVLIVDDDARVRLTLTRWCSYQKDMVVVGEAGDGAEALELAERVPADVIVMDVRMPKVDGLEATKRLRSRGIATPVVIFTAEEKAARAAAAMENVGFLAKGTSSPSETLNFIRRAARPA